MRPSFLLRCLVALVLGYFAGVGVVALAGCTAENVIEETTGETPAETIARECKERMLTCALVYEFPSTPSETPSGLLEMCVRDEDLPLAEMMFGVSRQSQDQRFVKWSALGVPPVCLWQCPTAAGCNSFSGCFCPQL